MIFGLVPINDCSTTNGDVSQPKAYLIGYYVIYYMLNPWEFYIFLIYDMHCYIHSNHDISKYISLYHWLSMDTKLKKWRFPIHEGTPKSSKSLDLLIHHLKNPTNDVILCSHHTTILVRQICHFSCLNHYEVPIFNSLMITCCISYVISIRYLVYTYDTFCFISIYIIYIYIYIYIWSTIEQKHLICDDFRAPSLASRRNSFSAQWNSALRSWRTTRATWQWNSMASHGVAGLVQLFYGAETTQNLQI